MNRLVGKIEDSHNNLVGRTENREVTIQVKLSESGVIYQNGTADYSELKNKPSIESVELDGNKSFEELGLQSMTLQELDNLL